VSSRTAGAAGALSRGRPAAGLASADPDGAWLTG